MWPRRSRRPAARTSTGDASNCPTPSRPSARIVSVGGCILMCGPTSTSRSSPRTSSAVSTVWADLFRVHRRWTKLLVRTAHAGAAPSRNSQHAHTVVHGDTPLRAPVVHTAGAQDVLTQPAVRLTLRAAVGEAVGAFR